MKTLRSRLLFIALLIVGGALSLLPRSVVERSLDPVSGRVVVDTVRRVPIELGLDLRGGSHLALEVDESLVPVEDCAEAIGRAERVIRGRMSEMGATEPVVQRSGECRLIVELPGDGDLERARSIVQRTAFLELRLVDSIDRTDALSGVLDGALGQRGVLVRGQMPGEYRVPETLVDTVTQLLDGSLARRAIPRAHEVRWGTESTAIGGRTYLPFYLVETEALVTGEHLVDAVSTRDPMNSQPRVQFELTRSAGRVFSEATGRSVGEHLAILLDGRVQGRPAVIQERIGSTGSIDLPGRTMREAGDLALVLRAGALPVPLEVVADGTVGPSLGSDSIAAGVRTSLLAVALVVLLMVGVYRFAGVLAVGALAMYLLGSLSGLALFGFTLTLPGIAGFALAIGMAVDANVLIFERIREELRDGRSPRLAVDTGFRHAMSAIVDSNITTALTAAILHLVGTEAVKGFALMLLIGLGASMFAAIFVTRTLFMVWFRKRGAAPTPVFRTVRGVTDTTFDLARWRRWALRVSGVLVVAGMVLLGARGPNYGIDFTGGTLLQVRTEAATTTAGIRSALADTPLRESEIQSFGSEHDYLVRTRVADGESDRGAASDTEAVREYARAAFDAEFGAGAWELVRGEGIGPEVGEELQTKAALAIAGSFAATLAWLAVRFESRFGVAAVAATAHDILATLAFISLLDLEVSPVTVAGVLTVIGYSLNDTIVIFDRVRENLRGSSGRDLRRVLDHSIRQTLPRTVLTTATTLAAALLLATLAGPVVRPLGLVMTFGIVVGTLSSIFVASPVLLWLSER